ncbi:MAG: glycosyltransferase, partial [Ignavibacteriaceae bacterium]
MLNILLGLIVLLLLMHYSFFLLEILTGLDQLNSAKDISIPEEFISIIIPFRNESENILESLLSLESQNFPKEKFEVIYVNDSSD